MAKHSNKKEQPEFTAQSWLFLEFMNKMKMNNVKSIVCWSEDKYGNQQSFEFGTHKKKNIKKALEFISK